MQAEVTGRVPLVLRFCKDRINGGKVLREMRTFSGKSNHINGLGKLGCMKIKVKPEQMVRSHRISGAQENVGFAAVEILEQIKIGEWVFRVGPVSGVMAELVAMGVGGESAPTLERGPQE